MNKIVLFFIVFSLIQFASAQSHKGISFQGVIKVGSDYPTRSGITVNARILSSTGCILREESFNGVNLSNGYINIPIGKGNVGGYDPGLSMAEVMDNSKVIANGPSRPAGLVCLDSDGHINAGVTSFNPAVSDGVRKFRLSLILDGTPVIADFNMRAVAYAVNSETLNGKKDTDLVSVNSSQGVTQTNVESIFSRYTQLDALLNNFNGSGTTAGINITGNAATATTAVTATNVSGVVAIANGGTGATTAAAARTNLGLGPLATLNPTGTADNTTFLRGDGTWTTVNGGVTSVAGRTGAVTLSSSDISGLSPLATLSTTGTPDGTKFLRDDGQWTAISTTDNTKLPLLGGTMGGAINMSGNDILNIGHMTMASQKTLRLGNYTNAQETALVGTLDSSYKGTTWFNGETNKMMYWDGASARALGTGTGNVSSVTGNAPIVVDNTLPAMPVISLGNIDASKIATGTLAPARLGSGTADNTKYLAGDGNWTAFPSTLSPSSNFAGDVSGVYNATSVDKIKGTDVSATPPTTNQVLQFDGSKWTPATISTTPSGAAGGDLTGSYPNPTLSSIVTAGTGTKITYDAKGRVISSSTPNTLSGYGISDAVKNGGGTGTITSGTDASKSSLTPATGDLYVATDTQKIYRYNGSAWDLMSSASGSGGTLTGVTADTPLSVDSSVATSPKVMIQKADASHDGYLSQTDWSAFNSKQPAGNYVTTLTGDVSSSLFAAGAVTTSVDKIKGVPVATALAGDDQKFLKFVNGSGWEAHYVKLSELKNALGTGAAFDVGIAGCTSAQTLVWTSLTDQFKCQDISLPAGKVTGLATVATSGSYNDLADKPAIPTCGANQYLTFNGTTFACANDAGASGTVASISSGTPALTFSSSTGTITANISDATTVAKGLVQLAANGGTTAGTVVQADDSRLADSRAPSGAAGGDLTGNYPNPTLTAIVAAGTGTKVTYDAKGRVTASTSLAAGDIPSLDWSKITTGKPTTLSGYGIGDAVKNGGGTGTITSGTDASKSSLTPATGDLFVATDTQKIYRYSGSAWDLMSSASGSGGTLTSVTADAPLAVDSSVATSPKVTIQKADATHDGYLSQTDWGTFNSKQAAGNYITTLTGDVTSSGFAGGSVTTVVNNVAVDKISSGSGKYFTYKPDNTACTANQVLKWVNNRWECANDDNTATTYSAGTGLDLTGTTFSVKYGTTAGTAVVGNDSRLTGAFQSSTALGGDLTGTLPNPAVARINGVAVSSAVAGDDQKFLKFINGSGWQPQFVKLSELKNNLGTASAFDVGIAGCTSAQTLVWTSLTDQFKCQDISLPASKVTGLATVATSGSYTDLSNKPSIPTCGANQYLTYNGTSYSCANDAGASGTVASISSGTPALTFSSSTGTITANISDATTSAKGIVQLAANNGTTAGTVVQADDSRLTNSRTPSGSAGGDLTGNYPNPTLNSIVTAGTGTKVTYDAKGRVTSSTSLAAGDIPSLDWSKITTGKPTTLSGYGIGDAVKNGGGTGIITSGTDASKSSLTPATGDLFVATDTQKIYRYNGSAWDLMSSASGSGGTITGVTAGAGLTGGGTSGSVTLNVDVGTVTAGTLPVARGGTGQSTYTDGQLLIGNTSTNSLSKATLSAGAGVSITNGNGSITISATGSGGTVTNVSGTAPISVANGSTAPVISLANGSAAGQVYRWDGTSTWSAAKLKYTDLINASSGSPWPASTCSSGQAVTWSSVSDSFTCTTLSIAATQLTGTLAAAQMPAFSGDVTSTAGTTSLTLSNSGVTAGTYNSVTVDAKGRVTGGTNPTTLAGHGITDAVKNAGSGAGNVITSIQSGNTAGRPAFGADGRLYVDTQAGIIYRDSGTAWVTVSSSSGTGISALTGDVTASGTGSVASTVNKVNGVTYPSGPSTNTVPVVTGANTITYQTVPLAAGGTGATTQAGAANNILPSQGANAGKVLQTDGTNVSWVTSSVSLSGDVSGTSAATSVDKIKGRTVASTAPTDAQFLVYNNGATQYAPASMSGDATMSNAGVVALKNTGTAGTYTKVTTDAQGRVTSGTTLSAADIPNLDVSKMTSGILPLARGGTGDSTYTDGQLLIGNTATTGLTKATLTAGSGVTITNGNGTITISATGGGSGTVTNVSGTAPISVANGTSTPAISLANGSAAGQVHRWDGTSSWATTKLKYTDLINASSGSPWPGTTCSAGQAVTWSSVSDSFTCTTLSIATTQLTGTLAAAQMPAFSGDVTSTAGSTTLTLATSGVTAGTYNSVTVDAKGRVTAGTNPTTLAGHGITDAVKNAGSGAGNVITSIQSGNTAGKPAASTDGRLYVDTQAAVIYRDNGTSWTAVASNSGTGISALTGDVTASGTGSVSSTVNKVNGVTYPTSPTTNTVPVVTGANTITYQTVPVAAGGTGQSTYTDGQLLIGNTATTGLSKATLTAGSGVTITNGNGTITISATGGGSGTVTNVSGTAPISVANGTSTPVISLTNGSAAGQVFRWDGTSTWAATKLKYTDLINTSAGSPWPGSTCTSGQAVTWSSASDSFSCTTLSIAATQLTGTLGVANGGTGATTAAGARTALGLGTAATVNTGSSAGSIPLLSTGGLVANQLCTADGTASGIICNTAVPTSSQWVTSGSNIYYNTGKVGIGTTPSYTLDMGSNTDAVRLPSGTNATRPANVAGLLRYNTSSSSVEFNNGSAWTALATSGGSYVAKSGDTMTGTLTAPNILMDGSDSANMLYVNNNSSSIARYPGVWVNNYAGATSGWPRYALANARGTSGSPTATTANDRLGELGFWGYSGSAWNTGARIYSTAISTFNGSNSESALVFEVAANGVASASETMRIISGKVGIGGITPWANLDVTGNMRASGCVYYNGGQSGTCASDERVKKDIHTFDVGLESLLGLRPVSFKYNGLGGLPNDGKTQLGFIAQDVEKVAPSLVKKEMVQMHEGDKEKTEIKVVDYGAFTYVIINAVKEMYHHFTSRMNTQDRAIAAVVDENKQLKQENAAIKAYLCKQDPNATFCR